MTIPNHTLIRLLDNLVGAQLREKPDTFKFWMRDGICLTPDLDDQDVATLARIASQETYEYLK